ncbi:non-heme iron oxygenase ferredoxin subunit [archaeon]|jgi:nitrite reductase (NADH) small subunit|nr:non-heme iron oxygenase ferredoxin subunit [archaeon]MBT4648083.1 non-heme iron oxygenase ferredoxin subunit [archaeon]MBT6822521.1 non-heme iron oxygenase ferredoxin subunit [archaeon]MBT7392522.1 non-heme iron oxygenase ferredoxin subunit [archaeon]
MSEFIKACPTSQVKEGEGKLVSIEGVPVAIFNVNGEYSAIHNLCTHQGAPLCEGHIDDGKVACPWHGWEFDVKTGECQFPNKNVKSFDVKVEDDYVFVKVK